VSTEALRMALQTHKRLLKTNSRWEMIGWLEAEIAALKSQQPDPATPQAAQAEPVAWISVEDRMPEPGLPVLVSVGKHVLRAAHAPKFTLNTDTWGDFEPDGGEYDEASDACYWPEGWYEWNLHEEVHWALDEAPTHWQPLPAAPAQGGQPGASGE
jgi:hypothetical protein